MFGDEKKIWKIDIRTPLATSPSDLGHEIWRSSFEEFRQTLLKKYSLPFPYLESSSEEEKEEKEDQPTGTGNGRCLYEFIELTGAKKLLVSENSGKDLRTMKKMTLTFFDSDLEENVSLDAENLVDFVSQKKKVLTVKYDTEVTVERRVLIQDPPPPPVPLFPPPLSLEVDLTPLAPPLLSPGVGNGESGEAEVSRVEIPTTEMTIETEGRPDQGFDQSMTWHWVKKENLDIPSVGSSLVAVNGIRMRGLDRHQVLAILKQRIRPLFLEFETSSPPVTGELPPNSQRQREDPTPPASVVQISAATFLAKYSHPLAKNLRKQVSKALANYVDYDWSQVTTNASSPQLYVTSLYRSIESELESLGLFDSHTPQGGGIPQMHESQWMDVRSHIETLIFNSIFEHTWALAPQLERYPLLLTLPPPGAAPPLKALSVPLQTKLAYLGFLSLQDLGISFDEHHQLSSPCVYYPYLHSLLSHHHLLTLPDEWRFALKELSRACEMKSPLKIMQKLKSAVTLASHALNSLLTHPERYSLHHTKDIFASSTTGATSQLVPYSQDVLMRESSSLNTSGSGHTFLGADDLMPLLSWIIIQANPPHLEQTLWLCSEFRHQSHHMGEYAYALTQISSAVEFLKEAQWSSFMNFQDEEAYLRKLKLFEETQELIEACRVANSVAVLDLLSRDLTGAVINGSNVNQTDTPLTVTIRCRNIFILKILLEHEWVNVDVRISPYHSPQVVGAMAEKGSKSRTPNDLNSTSGGGGGGGVHNLRDATCLMLAAMMGSLEMTLMLLEKGANRYLLNENGDSAATLAYACGHKEIVRVLFADPLNVNAHFANLLQRNDLFLMRGILAQPFLDINQIFTIDSLLPTDSSSSADAVDSVRVQSISPPLAVGQIIGTLLMGAVHRRNLQLVNLLLTSDSCDANLTNPYSETALMWCGKDPFPHSEPQNTHHLPTPDEDELRMDMALSLLRHGAKRYLTDSRGWTAFQWALHGSRTRGISDALGTALSLTSDPHHQQLSITTQIQAAKYPKLSAILYYDPERCVIWDLARKRERYGVFALLEQGVSINSSCPRLLYTPLIAAVYNQDLDLVSLLLKYPGLRINQPGHQGNTALHYAAQSDSVTLIGLLLRHGADRSQKNLENLTPLDYALGRGERDIINCLKYDPKRVSICLAAKHGDLEVFTALMNQGVSVNAKLKHVTSVDGKVCHELTTPLIAAVSFDQIEFIKALFDTEGSGITRHWPEQVDLNETNFLGQTPLMCAVQAKNEPLVLFLLKHGANRYLKDVDGNMAADWAIHLKAPALHMLLLCDPTQSCVHAAIRDGNIEATKAFFKQNPDPNMRWFSSQPYARGTLQLTGTTMMLPSVVTNTNGGAGGATGPGGGGGGGASSSSHSYHHREILDGEPPMIVAAKFNCIPVITLLLKAPTVDINIVDTFGKTALMHAAENGYEDCVLYLLKHKAHREALDYLQKKAFHYALENKHYEVAALLEADPYKIHIHDACEEGKVGLVVALMKQGCPVNYRDERIGELISTASLSSFLTLHRKALSHSSHGGLCKRTA
jgi:ankyrin repeat protein